LKVHYCEHEHEHELQIQVNGVI